METPPVPPIEGNREETMEGADYREEKAWHSQRIAKFKEKWAWAASQAEYDEYKGYYKEAWKQRELHHDSPLREARTSV